MFFSLKAVPAAHSASLIKKKLTPHGVSRTAKEDMRLLTLPRTCLEQRGCLIKTESERNTLRSLSWNKFTRRTRARVCFHSCERRSAPVRKCRGVSFVRRIATFQSDTPQFRGHRFCGTLPSCGLCAFHAVLAGGPSGGWMVRPRSHATSSRSQYTS